MSVLFKVHTFKRIKIPVRYISLGRHDLANVVWPRPDYGPEDIRRSVLMNGIRVAAANSTSSNTAACTIMFQSGSRYELDEFLGATHLLRASSVLSGCGYSGYIKSRYLAQHGGTLRCSSDRQTVTYTLRCPVPCFTLLKHFLLDTAARCCFNDWELDEVKKQVHTDLYLMSPEQRVLDLVQQACWAGPLGHSVYCEPERVDDLTENHLNCYVRQHYRTILCTVASVGVPFEETLKFAETIELCRDRPIERCELCAFPRAGFEEYDLGKGSDTWIAVAVPGCGVFDLTCLLKHSIIAAACGISDVQAGQHFLDHSPHLPLGLLAGGDRFSRFSAFNISYRETGVFGVLARTRAETAYCAAMAAAEFLANVGDLDFKQIEIGKKRLKLNLATYEEDSVRVAEGLAMQLANNTQMDIRESLNLVDAMSADSIACVAKSLSSKRAQMAVAVVGDIGQVPNNCVMKCGGCF